MRPTNHQSPRVCHQDNQPRRRDAIPVLPPRGLYQDAPGFWLPCHSAADNTGPVQSVATENFRPALARAALAGEKQLMNVMLPPVRRRWKSGLTLGLAGMFALIEASPAAEAGIYQASVTVDLSQPQGEIHPAIYGQYLEHVQTQDECIYPALWDAGSRFADGMGLRRDTMEAVRGLRVPVVRWPGGCFADVYHWENGIGERELRPQLPNRHWGGTESHQFGTDEFLQWCQQVGIQPYINVNLGSGSLAEALRWLEYCNGNPDTPQGKRRRANGHAAPYQVRYWGIGNETWGNWEVGHTNAAAYAELLAQWAAALRQQDPAIKILGVGSSEGADPAWDRAVLKRAGALIDFLTIHIYGSSTDYSGDQYEAVALTPAYFDFRLRQMLQTIDEVSAETGLPRPIQIALDEWNIRHFQGKQLIRKDPRNMQDAMFVSGVLNVLLRHSPRVGMANYVFLINGHAPLLVNAEAVVKTPIFYVFQQYALWMKGRTVAAQIESPAVSPPPPFTGSPNPNKSSAYRPGKVAYLDGAAAVHDDGTLVITLLNRHKSDSAEVSLRLPAGYQIKKSWVLQDDHPYAVNDFANPNRIVPVVTPMTEAVTQWRCAPYSVVMLSCVKGD